MNGHNYLWPDEADKLAGMLPVWRKPKEALPDSDLEVIVATKDGEVFAAFYDGEQWRDLTAMPLPEHHVTHWCRYPEPPETTPCL